MVSPSAGSVILVPFPFSDLSRSKRRPAVVLAFVGRDDWILCQITSNPYSDPLSIMLDDSGFASGSLRKTRYIRPGRLFTANRQLMVSCPGRLTPVCLGAVIRRIVQLMEHDFKLFEQGFPHE